MNVSLSKKALSVITFSNSLRKHVDFFVKQNSNLNPIGEEILVAENMLLSLSKQW
jgi:hypothetical protein